MQKCLEFHLPKYEILRLSSHYHKDQIKDQMKSSLVCPKCNIGCVPRVIAKCMECNHSMNSSMIERYEKIQNQLEKASEEEYSFEETFNQAVDVFHPFDISFMEFLNFHSEKEDYHQNSKNLSKCLEVSKIKLRHFYQYLPAFHMLIGKEEIQAAKLYYHLDFLGEAEEHINKAKDIFVVNFGEDHPILSKELKSLCLQIDERKCLDS